MPKRNVLLLTVIAAVSLVAWLARDQSRHSRQIGEVLAAIDRAYIEPADPDTLAAAALDGIMSGLDEHSAIVDGVARRELESALDQEFGGVGLELARSGDGIVVQSPVVGGPAWRAGIVAGDILTMIDGVDVRRLTVRDVVALLRGDVGSKVSVAVQSDRAGHDIDGVRAFGESRTVGLVREIVRTESVRGDRRRSDGSWEWFVEGEPGVAFVRITSFGERTPEELDAALAHIAAAPLLRGLVIDLRENPGGLLTAAVDVCDRFLSAGVIVSTRRRNGVSDTVVDVRRADPATVLDGVPVAVLIDGLTASAAEIVAACLQDHGRAVIVGSRSLGKGTVQSIVPLSDGRRLLKLTTAEYLRPRAEGGQRRSGTDSWGVSPDQGREIEVTAQVRAELEAWRRLRDSVPATTVESHRDSAADSPRLKDPVLAVALTVFASPTSDLGGEKEAPGDTDETVPSGDPPGVDKSLAG